MEKIETIVPSPISGQIQDDIHRLVKKIALSHSLERSEAQFLVEEGIFFGSRFYLLKTQGNLILKVSNASPKAKSLLRQHEKELKNRLGSHEINLQVLKFMV